MLAITRRAGEEVVIGTDPPTVIKIAEIRGNRVKLVIDAPTSLVVDRLETYQRRMTGTRIYGDGPQAQEMRHLDDLARREDAGQPL
jgi:carbon storage regulator CsrA